jgi:hypothetical protein
MDKLYRLKQIVNNSEAIITYKDVDLTIHTLTLGDSYQNLTIGSTFQFIGEMYMKNNKVLLQARVVRNVDVRTAPNTLRAYLLYWF